MQLQHCRKTRDAMFYSFRIVVRHLIQTGMANYTPQDVQGQFIVSHTTLPKKQVLRHFGDPLYSSCKML